jgi:tetratricopeptide (TPR) repeat protein
MLSGLEIDIDNLQLRVLADSHLGLGPERLNKLLGADVVWEEDHNPVDDSEPALAATAVADPDLSQLNQGGGSRPPRLVLRLVEGGVRLTSSFSTEEKAMLRVFSHPAHEARLHRTEAQMHRAAGDLDAAAEALRRAIAVYPRALVNFAELLWVFHRRKRLDDFVHALWHLYSVLNGAGRALRERFLGMGLALGQHQILEALLQATDRQQIEEIGRQFGLLPAEKNATRKLQLIDAFRYEPDDQGTESAADVHEEVNAYLEFGQLDQAIELLEATIVNDPADPRFYPTLLDLYDRMDDLDRFTALSAKIKRLIQRPPEEVVPMMISLQQRLQHRQQRARRAGE